MSDMGVKGYRSNYNLNLDGPPPGGKVGNEGGVTNYGAGDFNRRPATTP